MDDRTDMAVLTPADILTAASQNPEHLAYLGFMARHRGQTRVGYDIDLRKFKSWCESNGIPSMLMVSRVHLDLYLEWLQGRGYAEATVARRFGTVLLFLRAAYEEDIIKEDPGKRLRTPRVNKEIQRRTYLPTVEMVLLLREADKRPLDRALLRFMAGTALRVGETCSLDVESIHRDGPQPSLTFIGKGNRPAKILLAYSLLQVLDDYLELRQTGPLFLNDWNRRMTRANVDRMLQRCAAGAGITKKITPHGLRRTTARTLAEQGQGHPRHLRGTQTQRFARDSGVLPHRCRWTWRPSQAARHRPIRRDGRLTHDTPKTDNQPHTDTTPCNLQDV